MTYNIVKDGKISISKDLWIELNNNHDKEYIKQLISDAIIGLELPYREITEEEAKEDYDNLCNFNTSYILKEKNFFTRYDYKYDLLKKIIDTSNIGNKASDYFQQKNRFMCDSINAPSPYRTWHSEEFRMTLLNALWTLKYKEVNNEKLRSTISLRKYIASQFKPSAAKCIYELYNAKSVLDFSAGWGDRLAGFCATNSTEKYVGIDPNKAVHEGYKKQLDLYNTDKDIKLIESPAEDVELEDEFDLVFTSPPYFDVERYTTDDTQSWKRYKAFDDWMGKFLLKTIRKAWGKLKTNGHMVINISDVYCHHRINKICDPMNDFISGLDGAKYEGAMGMRMAKRPQSRAAFSGVFAEPMWIWKKV